MREVADCAVVRMTGRRWLFISGITIGPVAGGVLLENFWWGSVFVPGTPAMVLLVVSPVLPEYRNPRPGGWTRPVLLCRWLRSLPAIYGSTSWPAAAGSRGRRSWPGCRGGVRDDHEGGGCPGVTAGYREIITAMRWWQVSGCRVLVHSDQVIGVVPGRTLAAQRDGPGTVYGEAGSLRASEY